MEILHMARPLRDAIIIIIGIRVLLSLTPCSITHFLLFGNVHPSVQLNYLTILVVAIQRPSRSKARVDR